MATNKELQATYKARQARRGLQQLNVWVPFEVFDKIKLESQRENVSMNVISARYLTSNLPSNTSSISSNEQVEDADKQVIDEIAQEINARLTSNLASNLTSKENLVTMLVEEKPKSKMIKCQCPQCGYIARLARVWIDKGYAVCPQCKVTS